MTSSVVGMVRSVLFLGPEKIHHGPNDDDGHQKRS